MPNIKALISDFSRTIIFSREPSKSLNQHFSKLKPEKLSDHFYLNEEYLEFLEENYPELDKYIYTTDMFVEDSEFRPRIDRIFKQVFEPEDLGGIGKSDPDSYRKLAEKLNLQPEELVFVDDQPGFVSAAAAAGLNTVIHKSNPKTFKELRRILSQE